MRLSKLALLFILPTTQGSHPLLRNGNDKNEARLVREEDAQQKHQQKQEERNLQECVARSTYLGCFNNENNDRALPREVFGPKSRGHSAVECEAG